MSTAAQHSGSVAALLEAARDPACRMPALLRLSSEAPIESLPEVLSLFCARPVQWPDSDAGRYAFGLALWRCGERSRALRTWRKLPPDESGTLRRAAIAHAAECLKSGRMGECRAVLEWISPNSGPTAEVLGEQLAREAQRDSDWLLAASVGRN